MVVKQFVNEEKRTCVTVIMNAQNALRNKLFSTNIRGVAADIIPDRYVGIAKCAPDDEFDPEIGLALSRERAFLKFHKAWNRELNRVHRRINRNVLTRIEKLYKPMGE